MNKEQVLVTRAQNGELSAFRQLVELYKKNIYYLSYDLTGSHHNAEDLSQDVFIKVFQSIKSFRGEAKLSSWIYRITVNTFISQYRKKSYSAMKLWHDLNDEKEGERDPQEAENRAAHDNPPKSIQLNFLRFPCPDVPLE